MRTEAREGNVKLGRFIETVQMNAAKEIRGWRQNTGNMRSKRCRPQLTGLFREKVTKGHARTSKDGVVERTWKDTEGTKGTMVRMGARENKRKDGGVGA